MRTHITLLRGALALLLVVTGCLFAVGSTIERHHRHHESTATKSSETGGATSGETSGKNGGETGGEASKPKPAEHVSAEAVSRIFGVDTESKALSIIAVIASLALAAAVWLRPARVVLVAVAVFGLVFAAGDGRELASAQRVERRAGGGGGSATRPPRRRCRACGSRDTHVTSATLRSAAAQIRAQCAAVGEGSLRLLALHDVVQLIGVLAGRRSSADLDLHDRGHEPLVVEPLPIRLRLPDAEDPEDAGAREAGGVEDQPDGRIGVGVEPRADAVVCSSCFDRRPDP